MGDKVAMMREQRNHEAYLRIERKHYADWIKLAESRDERGEYDSLKFKLYYGWAKTPFGLVPNVMADNAVRG